MKISFPKYGPVELLTRKSGGARIISLVAIVFFAGVCGRYFLGNKLWLLTIAVLGIVGILLCLGVAVAIFFNQGKINEAPSIAVEENVPQFPSIETSDGLSSDPFEINNNVWFNDNSLEDAASTFVSGPTETEETITGALSQTTDPVCSGPNVEDAAV